MSQEQQEKERREKQRAAVQGKVLEAIKQAVEGINESQGAAKKSVVQAEAEAIVRDALRDVGKKMPAISLCARVTYWTLYVLLTLVLVLYCCFCCPIQRPHLTGLVVALVAGHLASFPIWTSLHWYCERQDGEQSRVWWFPVMLGFAERGFFFMLVVAGTTGLGGGLATWTALKLVNGWGRLQRGDRVARLRAMSAVLISLVSLGFAVAGGILWRDGVPVWWSWGLPWHCAAPLGR